MVNFFLNNQNYQYTKKKNLSIFELIQYFNCQNAIIIVEHNKILYNKIDWKKIFIKNNDRVEFITIVGGG